MAFLWRWPAGVGQCGVCMVSENARRSTAGCDSRPALNFCSTASPAPRPRREAEKAASSLLQQAGQARSLIDQAAAAFQAAVQQVEELKAAEKEAAAEVGEARGLLKQLETAARRR